PPLDLDGVRGEGSGSDEQQEREDEERDAGSARAGRPASAFNLIPGHAPSVAPRDARNAGAISGKCRSTAKDWRGFTVNERPLSKLSGTTASALVTRENGSGRRRNSARSAS